MAKYRYRSRTGRSYRSYDAGQEAALRHIEEARQFSQEIGGYDDDVKKHFFSLNGSELERIFLEYGQRFGSDTEQYARQTIAKWKSGQTKMSGLVAKRLFGLLPEFMPTDKKYELAGNIWKHFGPTSSHDYVVGPSADPMVLGSLMAQRLEDVVLKYDIPDNIKRRFTWLAAGDIRLREQLLNHFRQLDRTLVMEKLQLELPMLQRHMSASPSSIKQMRQVLTIHKHEFNVWIENSEGSIIREGRPSRQMGSMRFGGRLLFFIVVAALILLYLLSRR